MKTLKADLWELHAAGAAIVVTTNFTIKANGEAVMGRGIAKQAMLRYPELPRELGNYNRMRMPLVYHSRYGIYTFAVKHNWWEDADPDLIRMSYQYLFNDMRQSQRTVAISRPGCGNGHLDWKEDVEPIFAATLYNYSDIDQNLIFVP